MLNGYQYTRNYGAWLSGWCEPGANLVARPMLARSSQL